MRKKVILEKLNEENKRYVPDVRDKVVTRAKAEGLLELEDGKGVLRNGNTAVAVKSERRAVAIASCIAVAVLSLSIAIPALAGLSGGVGGPDASLPDEPSNPVAPVDPDDPNKPDEPLFPDAPVIEEMGVDYAVGAVSTVKLMSEYALKTQPAKARSARVAARAAESGIENFGIYFSAFDCFFTKDLLTARYSSRAGEHYDKSAKIYGKYADGVAAEFVMNYCEALDITTSTQGVYNYYLEGYINFGYSDYALTGWRTVTGEGDAQTQASLEISAYPNFNDKTTYAKMELTDEGYAFTVVTGGSVQSEAVLRKPDGMQNAAYLVDIKGGNGGSFTVGMPSEGRSEVTVDYVCGDVTGQFFADKTDNDYGFILCDYLLYKPSADGLYWIVTGLNEERLNEDGKVVIPTYVQGKPVKEIAYSAFTSKSKIKSAVIPDCVEKIGSYAFWYCSGLTEVVLPAGLKAVDNGTFANCTGLEKIALPDSVESIGARAFDTCVSLTEFNIPESLKNIYTGAFSNCAGFKDLYLHEKIEFVGESAFACWNDLQTITVSPENRFIKGTGNCLIDGNGTLVAGCATSVIPDDGSVKRIGSWAFARCAVERADVPASVSYIGDYAFRYCLSLTQITLPDTGIYIGEDVFDTCAYYRDDANWEDGALYIGKHLIAAQAISSGELIIKAGTLTIVDGAVNGCVLDGVVFNKELLYIGERVLNWTVTEDISFDGENGRYYAEGGCLIDRQTKILIAASRNAVIPEGEKVEVIGRYAFNAYNGTKLIIPACVKRIEYCAFNGNGFNEVVVKGNVEVDSFAFMVCSLQSIEFEDAAILYSHSFEGCNELMHVVLNRFCSLSTETFYSCLNLRGLHVEMTVEEWLDLSEIVPNWYDPVAEITVTCLDGRVDKWGHILETWIRFKGNRI